jgi:1,4-dihydroxy-2-naphthoate octaprenyltransferase
METLSRMVRLARPHFLLGGILFYALGGGIAQYLGYSIRWDIYLLGQAWGTILQLAVLFLNEYFDAPDDLDNPNRTFLTGGSGQIGPGKLPRAAALWGAIGSLAALASLTVALVGQDVLAPVTVLYMVLIFLGAFFYSVPPVRLVSTGYGELTTSILVAHLVPGFAFLLQTGELNQVLMLATFPLVILHMAMLIAFSLPDFGNDTKHGKQTLLVRIGWQAGMRLHNLLLLGSFFFLALAMLISRVSSAIWIWAFLPLPLALLQIWQMNRIAIGVKPHWTALALTALAPTVSMTYLLAWSFWIR